MGIYHPPKSNTNNSTMNKFHEELSDYLTDNINNYEELIIMGDTNIHYDSKTNHETIAFQEFSDSFGLQQLLNCPHIDQVIVLTTLSSKIIVNWRYLNQLPYGKFQTIG